MTAYDLAGLQWKRLEPLVSVHTIMIGFVDGSVLGAIESGAKVIEGPSGIEFLLDDQRGVCVFTGEGGAYDAEVALRADGSMAALRCDFVNDIAELDGTEGEWTDWQQVDVHSGSLLVCDPFAIEDPSSRLFVPFPNGRHQVQVWVHSSGEILGIRAVPDASSPAG